ncbi:DNA excision repair protein ERCC-6 [Nasonia vitripennis]|uniref:DNA repair and recombination protein RAD54-like n=1 Tax=Nasonia vitripennis TaxID=7425 RepID=A0A7M7QR39_NASVI|nr:DNA excision repair protein ERCC-6 [Nasonia vitripennis]XP_008208059.1 DNA excision repair protein ERCC-6 [Nasonia vitripennis]XP_032452410.1 DNA excision repair protein ERCC-6 [Nasonia vitripennis]
MEVENQSGEDGDEISEVISMQSESSILQKAAEDIKKLVKNNATSKNLPKENESKGNPEQLPESSILRARLQDQVRTGEITPFQAAKKEKDTKNVLGRTLKESTQLLDLEKYLFRQAELAKQKKLLKKNKISQNEKEKSNIPTKKMKMVESNVAERKKNKSINSKNQHSKKSETITSKTQQCSTPMDLDLPSALDCVVEEHENNLDSNIHDLESSTETSNTLIHEQVSKVRKSFNLDEEESETGSEYVPSDEYDSEEETAKKSERRKKSITSKQSSRVKRVLDDGDEDIYRQRVEQSDYKKNEPLHKVDNLFKVPLRVWKHLYKYQKVAVKWMWELHSRNLGGLLGDEMGLGKTVQVIAFLAGLDCSDLLSDGGRFRGLGPSLIVCPATLLEQWVKHFHDWWPTLRAVILHQSGTFQGDIDELLHTLKDGGILVTSYTGVLIHKEPLLKFKWHYVILDEGHKIRNPDAKVSKVVKAFLTPHRILLTGSPMQNSLKELWSLFDFILPGKLGTLPAFMEHCAGPITRGGYANASQLQEATALQVATMLKDAITPYMLRRTKFDVQHHVSLPDKNEQVLFCSLTEEQRQLYIQYLRSDDVSFVIHERREGGRYRARLLVALTALRKICNHPDLFLYTDNNQEESDEDAALEVDENEMEKFGHWKRAGKMTVVRSLLKIWKKQGHRVLLFTQSRQMMHILEGLLQKEKYNYLRMDGTTPMGQRQLTVTKFNQDPSYFVFLLTTRVGGLGVNLTGANRVIIYDPDWNPATDAQARERAWRIGQEKSVTVYRLITAGTIEEKMYHRQVFKILLSNKVLEDPRQRRLFRTTDLTELFNLNEPISGGSSESDQLFRDSKLSPNQSNFSSSKIEAMKKLAAALSKKIGEKANNKTDTAKDKTKEQNSNATTSKDEQKISDSSLNSSSVGENKDVSVDSVHNITDTKEFDNTVHEDDANEIEDKKNESCNLKTIDQESLVTEDDKVDHKSATIKKKELKQIGPKMNSTEEDVEEGEIVEASGKSTSKLNKKSSGNAKKVKASKHQKAHRKHKKHRKNKEKVEDSVSAMFEGERVSCLIGRRLGKSKEPDPIATADDQYVLSKLFSKAAVSSAFQHESVLSNAVLNPEEETPLQRAAKSTASEKMDCIRQSRKWCWKPSWDKPPEEQYDDDD